MAPQSTRAIILWTRDFSETSKLIYAVTEAHGILKTLGKGVRREKSPMRGQVEIFNHGRMLFYPSRSSDLHVLGKFELIDSFPEALGTLEKTALFYYFGELTLLAGYGSEHGKGLFDLLFRTLTSAGAINRILNTRFWFELRFLKEMAVFPPWNRCGNCSRFLSSRIWFSPRDESWICPTCARNRKGLIEITADLSSAIRFVEEKKLVNIQNLTL